MLCHWSAVSSLAAVAMLDAFCSVAAVTIMCLWLVLDVPHVFPICGVRAANHCSLFHDSSRDCLFGHFPFPFRRIVFGLFGLHTYQLISLWTILLTQTPVYIVNIYYII